LLIYVYAICKVSSFDPKIYLEFFFYSWYLSPTRREHKNFHENYHHELFSTNSDTSANEGISVHLIFIQHSTFDNLWHFILNWKEDLCRWFLVGGKKLQIRLSCLYHIDKYTYKNVQCSMWCVWKFWGFSRCEESWFYETGWYRLEEYFAIGYSRVNLIIIISYKTTSFLLSQTTHNKI
jgi:hypothetical protein